MRTRSLDTRLFAALVCMFISMSGIASAEGSIITDELVTFDTPSRKPAAELQDVLVDVIGYRSNIMYFQGGASVSPYLIVQFPGRKLTDRVYLDINAIYNGIHGSRVLQCQQQKVFSVCDSINDVLKIPRLIRMTVWVGYLWGERAYATDSLWDAPRGTPPIATPTP